jgi:hypothetical protein
MDDAALYLFKAVKSRLRRNLKADAESENSRVEFPGLFLFAQRTRRASV